MKNAGQNQEAKDVKTKQLVAKRLLEEKKVANVNVSRQHAPDSRIDFKEMTKPQILHSDNEEEDELFNQLYKIPESSFVQFKSRKASAAKGRINTAQNQNNSPGRDEPELKKLERFSSPNMMSALEITEDTISPNY